MDLLIWARVAAASFAAALAIVNVARAATYTSETFHFSEGTIAFPSNVRRQVI
jgi:hypothetical protein